MVVEEVCGLFTISEEQHAHHAVQGKDGGSLGAHSIGDVECPESILANLKGEANHAVAPGPQKGWPWGQDPCCSSLPLESNLPLQVSGLVI